MLEQIILGGGGKHVDMSRDSQDSGGGDRHILDLTI